MYFETLTLHEPIFTVLIDLTAIIAVFGTFIMRRKSRFNRSRRLLATSLSTWAIAYIYVGIRIAFGFELMLIEPYFNLSYCLMCLFFTLAFLTYPIEVVLPGWLSERRWLRGNIPAFVCVMVYVVSNLSGFNTGYPSFDALMSKFFTLRVWPRFLLLFVTYCYLFYVIYIVVRQSQRYKKWCHENYAEGAENHSVRWLYGYLLLLFVVTVLFCATIYKGSPVVFLCHSILVPIMMIYVIICGNKQDCAFPEGFFKNDMNADISEEQDDEGSGSFESRLPDYVRTINNWLDSVKPYLDPNFKLTDTADVVPLNRSYLSRIYNEGFGKSFTILVRDRRMAEARRLIAESPDLSVAEIAERSGFSSRSTFHRSFVALNDGLTPREYKETLDTTD